MQRGQSSKLEGVRRVLDDLARRRERGEFVPVGRVIGNHPDLMPELAEALAVGQNIRHARLEAEAAGPASRSLTPVDSADLLAPIDVGSDSADSHPVTRPAVRGYVIVNEVGSGGQAVVYDAVQESTGRRVAIKILPGGPFTRTRQRERFDREAAILATLDHPYVVGIVDRGRTADGSYYLVMPYIDGTGLDEFVSRIRGHPGGWQDMVRLFARLSSAVGEAHRRGVVHRDLKPSNVRVDARGDPHVLDFGLARLTADGQVDAKPVTVTGQVVGSLPWSSPEQVAGVKDVGPASDVYSLGVMLYEALTGRPPYAVTGPAREVMNRITKVVPAPPSRRGCPVRGRAGAAVDAVVLQALAKSPARRYTTAAELAIDLEALVGGNRVGARPRPVVTRRRVIGMGLATVMIGALWGAYSAARPRWVEVIALPSRVNSIGMKLVRIPAGGFRMGGPKKEPGWEWTEQDHEAFVTQPFFISVTEVTRGQYRAVMGKVPYSTSSVSDNLPVSDVAFGDAEQFCRQLSALEGLTYRLPTETEWEYAGRAGKGSTYAGTGILDDMGWYRGNSGGVLHPVGLKSPNHWGLFDMHGNVAEWCSDPYATGTPPGRPVRPGPGESERVTRGGTAAKPDSSCGSARRDGYYAARGHPFIGFRVVQSIE